MTYRSRKPREAHSGHGRKCRLCVEKVKAIDYKDTNLLRNFIDEQGKIVPRKATRHCAKHQRMVAKAIKAARNIALMPYVNDYIK